MRQEKAAAHVLAAAALAFPLAIALALAAVDASAQTAGPETLGFKKHFVVEITNPSKLTLESQAIILDVAEIRSAVAADFNTYMYAFFEVQGRDYNLVVSQADDLDKDRYHDEIVLVRTLPPASTTRLVCYYTPNRSFQLMPTSKAFARGPWETGGAEAGWESNLVAYEFLHGGIGIFGKLQPGLIMKGFPAALAKSDWGQALLDPGESAGAGGLSLWDGAKRLPLFGPSAPQAKLTVISPGPLRGLVKAEYPAVKTAAGDVSLTAYFSAFADNAYSRQDVVIAAKPGAAVVLGPGLEKLTGETTTIDKDKGIVTVYGRGAGKAGPVGLAAIFAPADLAGLDDAPLDHAVKLTGRTGRKLTYWVFAAWERGATAADASSAKAWTAHAADLAARLLVPVKVEFKAR
jgi:hypothetical protein